MYELATWIDQNIANFAGTLLYKKYFGNSLPEELEDTDVFFLKNSEMGIDVVFDEELIASSIHLYSGSTIDGKTFSDQLPFKITFDMGHKRINQLLGPPDVHGGEYDDSLLGYIDFWEKYFLEKYSLHLMYAKDKRSILLITLDSPKFEQQHLRD